jgi:hypothetical protein
VKNLHLALKKISELENSKEPSNSIDFKQVDNPKLEKLSSDSDVSELLTSFQKMRLEEQRLLETKQQLLSKQNDLRNKLLKEIEKTKEAIANLTSELPDLQNKTKLLGEALDIHAI